jgi:hypothetical protein
MCLFMSSVTMFEFDRLTNSCCMTRYELYVRGTSGCIASDNLRVEIDCDTHMAGSTICLIYTILCMKRNTRVWPD